MAYEFKSNIIYETIEVDVLYKGSLIATRRFSATNFTENSATEALQFEAENFGFVGLDGSLRPASIQTPEPDLPVNPLQSNMDNVMSSISQINDSISPDMFNINIDFMSDDDVLKKMIMTQSSSIPEERISPETADQIVAAYPNNHPTKTLITDKKKEVTNATKQLGIKGKEITDGITQLTTETIASFVTIGSSATILPPGAGVPTAFSAVQGLFASLKAFQTKLNQLEPVLEPLKNVEMLVPDDSPATSTINTALGTLNGLISGVASVISPITQVQNVLGSTSVPGVTSQPQAIKWDGNGIWGTKTILTQTQVNAGGEDGKVWISCSPIKGTWKYTFWWSSDNDPGIVNSNSKSINVWPTTTTKYTVRVQNDDGTGSYLWGHWVVTVV